MRLLRGCALVLGGMVALVVVAYLAHGLTASVRLGDRQEVARQVVRDGRPQRAGVTARRDSLRPALAALGPPVRSWSSVSCGMGTRDSGFIVRSYVQECDALAVDVYDADGRDAPAVAGALHGRADTYGGCPVTIEGRGLPAPDPHSAWVRWFPSPPPADRDWCRPPTPAGDFLERAAYPDITTDEPLTADAYVVVEVRDRLPETDLGCSPWGLVFCVEPVHGPVLPEWAPLRWPVNDR